MGDSLSCQHTLLLHVWGTGTGPVLNHLCKVLLGVVSRVRWRKQQLQLFLTYPRGLEGVIWRSLQLLKPLSMDGILPREVSHISPCDAASAPPCFPASPGIQDFRAEFPGGRTTLPVLLHSLGSMGLQMSKQIQIISVQNRSLKTPASSKTQHPSPLVLQYGPLCLCAALLRMAKLCIKGEEARESPGQEECSQSLHSAFWC